MLRPQTMNEAGLSGPMHGYPSRVRSDYVRPLTEAELLSNLLGVLADWGPAKAIECEYEPSLVWRVWAVEFQGERMAA